MSNMSHCRFENTFEDLEDCFENMGDETLSDREDKYKKKLIQLCHDITADYITDDYVDELEE